MSDKWCLKDIYAGFESDEFKADFTSIPSMVEKLNLLSYELSTFENVVELVRLLEEYSTKNDRLGSYAHFVYATDTANTDATKFIYLLDAIGAETSRTKVRLASFLSKIEETGGNIAQLAKQHNLEEYTYQMQHMAKEYYHMMSEDEETLSAQMSNTGSSAWGMLQDKLISMLSCEYADPKDGGKIRTIGINECRNLAYDADSQVRKAAYEAELAAYPKIEESCAAAMNSIKGEVNLLCSLRKFNHPIDRTLFDSSMTRKTLDAMFQAIDANIQCFRDYMKAKARYLNPSANGLPFYDMFAPVGQTNAKTFTYEEAKTFTLENFGRFSSEMEKVARMAFENNWIDVSPREGKVSGAFCGDIYAVKQFRIVLNYGGNLSDIITLAHELGHGYHSMQVMEEGILNTHYPMPLAETASTFCEMIVTNAALQTLPNNEKLQLIENSLQDATQVILDIYSRYLFEKGVFEARQDHPLSVQELNELMLNAQRTAYGDGLDPEKMHPYMWVIKPHYYSGTFSFYNFPYAFGNLLANGLYKIYDADPSIFGEKYNNFLRASGKMSVEESCKMLGIDVQSADFWESALDVIKSQIDQFKKLTSEVL
ncbi:MAG: M3 family oligoendopeptidase [Defluviitaleaceae bacterium]|nr:M3 family oligoendopeptidase [Defluviitaleaceae bacterium]